MMRMCRTVRIMLTLFLVALVPYQTKAETWPDGTPIDRWFADTAKVDVNSLGKKFVITDYGVRNDSTVIQTEAIQRVIDITARQGGGVIVVPEGTFLSGSLFFRQGTHLHLMRGAVLKGSDRIKHFPVKTTRMEGQTLDYFCALINVDGVDGFTITGQGTINGNGHAYWEEFWIRRRYNPDCTNLEAMRPRLVYISNSRNVTVQDVRLVNSPFWTNHLYRCDHVRYINCYIYAPTENVYQAEPQRGAPSSDAIDLDVCHDILIYGCYMHVSDDAVVLKGGKGTWADKNSNNGHNANILIEKCRYGRVYGCLTIGSESLYDRNIVLRNCHSDEADRVLWLKMRPDTPQHYEYVSVDGMTGKCGSFLVVRPWTQFFKAEERPDMPLSQCNNIVMRNVNMSCRRFFDVGASDKYALRNFTFENVNVCDGDGRFDKSLIDGVVIRNVLVNGARVK